MIGNNILLSSYVFQSGIRLSREFGNEKHFVLERSQGGNFHLQSQFAVNNMFLSRLMEHEI